MLGFFLIFSNIKQIYPKYIHARAKGNIIEIDSLKMSRNRIKNENHLKFNLNLIGIFEKFSFIQILHRCKCSFKKKW